MSSSVTLDYLISQSSGEIFEFSHETCSPSLLKEVILQGLQVQHFPRKFGDFYFQFEGECEENSLNGGQGHVFQPFEEGSGIGKGISKGSGYPFSLGYGGDEYYFWGCDLQEYFEPYQGFGISSGFYFGYHPAFESIVRNSHKIRNYGGSFEDGVFISDIEYGNSTCYNLS